MSAPYCSELSATAGEPMLGTADRVDAWLMLSYRGTWRAKAIADNELPAAVQRWLSAQVEAFAAKGLKARPQFVRQSSAGADAPVARATLFVATEGRLHRMDAERDTQFTGLDLTRRDVLQSCFHAVEAPQYFVCTNGQRDVCCARFGLPLYARLRELVGRRAWQTTHVGGHRFAPNVLALPQGALYGRVAREAAANFVATVEAGQLCLPHLRGRSALPPQAQAAESALREPALEVVSCEAEEVVLRAASGCFRVAVRPTPSMGVLASCGAEQTKAVSAYAVAAPPVSIAAA